MSSNIVRRMGLAILASALSAPIAFAQPTPAYVVSDHIKAPDGGYDYASFDPVHRRLYLSRAGGVLALDVDTKVVTAHLTDGQRTHETLPLNDGARLLVTDSGSNSAHLVDALSGKSLAELPAGEKPDAALFEPVSGLAVVVNGASGDLTLIDPAAKTVVGKIVIGGGLEFGVADGTGKVFINIEDQNQIAVVDIKSRAVLARYPLKGCDGPTGLAYAADAGVLISACANHVAKVIQASDGADLATLAIGSGPDAVLYDASRHLAFIPCGRDGVLEVIAVRGPADVAVVQTVKTGPGARTGALDPKTGAIYLPTLRYAPAVGAAKPAPLPGTFELLVVTPAT
jgi:hypothetical protein